MDWRDSYTTLLELFPQVDARLIRGAALEHRNDVGAAAEFILNEVLGADEASLSDQELPDTSTQYGFHSSFEELEQRSASAEEEQAVTATDIGTSVDELLQDEQVVVSVSSSEALRSSESHSGSAFLHITAESEAEELTGEFHNESRDELLTMEEVGERVEPEVSDADDSGSMEPLEEDELGLANIVHQMFLLSRRKRENQSRTSDISEPLMSANQESVDKSVTSVGAGEHSTESLPDPVENKVTEEYKREFEHLRDKSQVLLCNPSTSNTTLTQERNSAVSEDDKAGEAVHIDLVLDDSLLEVVPAEEAGPPPGLESGQGLESQIDGYTAQERKHHLFDLEAESVNLMRVGSHEEHATRNFTADEFPVYDESISVPKPAYEEDEVALNDGLDSMMSIHKSAITEEMDRADWENVNCISVIQMNQMEPLDNLVEEAKADKEALISSIEEIRVLRLMTDQAEYAARQAREEAGRGGADVMAKVDEMRKILSRARETNAVHAGEVFGEKAVLATEARELQYRLAQVNSEKAKAVAALNEIKVSLQARIESAVREREAAEQEKIEKELLAKDALTKEETLLAKVAQESRDLDAEAEACTKIRDFLIERGSIVDALQGEVAVLREDAECLKKDLESMSLSFSALQVNMLSQTSDIYIASRSGKFSESFGQASDGAVHEEGGAIANSNSGSLSLRTPSLVQKGTSDRKSWSSLPSLLRGLSNSQDLNGSSHSGYSSNASNSLSASRDALDVNQGERSQLLGSENSMTDAKYPSSPNSPTSPEEKKQAERELLKAKMAMFPGEELEMEYLGTHNLDVFRSENPNGSSADADEDDWQMLEKVISRSSSRSSGDK